MVHRSTKPPKCVVMGDGELENVKRRYDTVENVLLIGKLPMKQMINLCIHELFHYKDSSQNLINLE